MDWGGAVQLGGEYISKQIVANSHNNLYRGELLYDSADGTTGHFDSLKILKLTVFEGDFSDIYIGDYIRTWDPTVGSSATTDWLVAAIDFFTAYTLTGTASGDGAAYHHHLVLIPRQLFSTTYPLNSSNTNKKGYYNTTMCKTTLPGICNTLQLSHYFGDYLETDVLHFISTSGNGTAATGASWYTCTAILPSEVWLTGCPYRQNNFDTGEVPMQFPLFRLRPDLIYDVRDWYWLSTLAPSSSVNFCIVYTKGDIGTVPPQSNYAGLRPVIIF